MIGVLRALQVDVFSKLSEYESKESAEGDFSLHSQLKLKDINKRITHVEPIGLSRDFANLMLIYDRFEKGEVYKPNYERQKQILK